MTARTMTRQQYHAQRRMAFRSERDAALLVGTSFQANELRQANSLRAELAAPSDAMERQRSIRWARLNTALRVAYRATVLRQTARRIAAEGVPDTSHPMPRNYA